MRESYDQNAGINNQAILAPVNGMSVSETSRGPNGYDPAGAVSGRSLQLNTQTLLSLRQATSTLDSVSGSPGGLRGVESLAHEATHAYLDIYKSLPRVSDVLQRAEAYYKDAPLENGTRSSDPTRLAHEAAAEYVGNRVRAYYEALSELQNVQARVNAGTWSSDAAIGRVANIERDYDRAMGRSEFGYEGTSEVHTTRPISGELKSFLDSEVLDGRIPDRFQDDSTLRDLAGSIRSGDSPAAQRRQDNGAEK